MTEARHSDRFLVSLAH